MATIREIIDYVDEAKPNAYSDKLKVAWLNDVDLYIKENIARDFLTVSISKLNGITTYDIPEDVTSDNIHTVYDNGVQIPKIDYRSYKEKGYWIEEGKLNLYPSPTGDDVEASIKIVYIKPFDAYRYVEYSTIKQVDFTSNSITNDGDNFENLVDGDVITITGCVTNAWNNKTVTVLDWDSTSISVANSTFATSTEMSGINFKRVLNDILVLPQTYHKAYHSYLYAQIDYLNRDYDDYNNHIARYNSAIMEFENYYLSRLPVDKSAKIINLWG